VRATPLHRQPISNVDPHFWRVVWVENALPDCRTIRQGSQCHIASLWGCGPSTQCCLRDHVDYNTARLPECLRRLLVVRSTCHFAYYALASSVMSPGSFPSGWSAARGEWASLIHRWQPIIIARGRSHRQCRPSAVIQRAGAGQSPQGSKVAGSILGASVELFRWGLELKRASAISICGKRGYFDPDEAARETELHSTVTDRSPTSQVKHGIVERWWTLMGEGLYRGSAQR
jgi:hypothetical protein